MFVLYALFAASAPMYIYQSSMFGLDLNENFPYYLAITTGVSALLVKLYQRYVLRNEESLQTTRWSLLSGEQRITMEHAVSEGAKKDIMLKAVAVVNMQYLLCFAFFTFYLLPKSPISIPFHVANLISAIVPLVLSYFFF